RNSYGYRELLVYKKAEALQLALADFVKTFPRQKTLADLADQMERSARSTKQNIIEGWKRNSTNEYYQFLGYAVASNAELEADCTDICIGIYESKGLKGIESNGTKRAEQMGEKGVGSNGSNGMKGVGSKGEKWVKREEMGELEKIPFYPLDTHLPPCLQLKLRAKELNYLLDKLQNSLLEKMKTEKTLAVADRIRSNQQKESLFIKNHEAYLKEKGWD
ncbi:MAG: four helix bundle protein, partial [Parcubacteria group bacterium]|nr:four helix bundle protein [Parcubacteria group bacterium]